MKNHLKMLLRSIRDSLGRYLAILAIVAMGVGFTSGLKSSQPDMVRSAADYLEDRHMYDWRLMSSLGLTEEDVNAFSCLEEVRAAEGAFFCSAMVDTGDGERALNLMSLTTRVATPQLTCGRLPTGAKECLGDSLLFSESDLGRTFTVLETEGTTEELLAETEFTLVGLCRSPRYISTDRGTTYLGSGTLEGFLVIPSEAFCSEAYHEILLWCDLGEAFSAEYEAARDALEPRIEAILNHQGTLRRQELEAEVEEELQKAENELADGWAQWEDGVRQLQEETEKAEKELADGEQQLADGAQELTDGEAELDRGEAELKEKQPELDAAAEKLAAGKAELDAQEEKLKTGEAELDAALQEVEKNEATLLASRTALTAAENLVLAPYDAAVTTAENRVSLLESQLENLNQESVLAQQRRESLESRLDSARADLETACASRLEAAEQFADTEAELADGEAQLAAARAQIEAGQAEIDSGKAQIAAARTELETQEVALAEGFVQLEAAQKQIDDGRRELEEGRRQLEDSRRELEDGRKELAEKTAEAEQELADAKKELEDGEQELADARQEAEEQLRLEVYVLNRQANSGLLTFTSDTAIVAAAAKAFPLFFALISALVCVTTMTRMVGEERTQIGTLKAMGCSGVAVAGKYLIYSGSAALLGAVVGYLLGSTLLPWLVWIAYGTIYDYANLRFLFDPAMFALCAGVAVLGILGVTAAACGSQLREKPAELIRPRPPRKGKTILLERIRPLWGRISFLTKVTLRNAFRRPARVLMMIVGIGGCTALMAAGFGVKDSVAHVLDVQYSEINFFEMTITLDTEKVTCRQEAEELLQEAETWQPATRDSVTLTHGEASRSANLIVGSGTELTRLIDLHTTAGQPISWPEPGQAVICTKLADLLNLQVGDVFLMESEELGSFSLTVSGVCANYLNRPLYVCPETVGSPDFNTAYAVSGAEDEGARLAADLRAEEGVNYVSLARDERDLMEKSMSSIDLIVILLVVCSAGLALITIYNLTNINIMERIREIATVKVLGFRPQETAAYVLNENLLLCFLGALVGIPLGRLLHGFVMQIIQVDNMTYDVRIEPMSYVWSFLITLVFIAGANLLMRPKLEQVDMAQSLKSVE